MNDSTAAQTPSGPPPGFYEDDHGREQWWDGSAWTGHYRPRPEKNAPRSEPKNRSTGPLTHGSLNVKREASYVRNQKGHSVTKHVILAFFTVGIGLIYTLYCAISPNHYFHL